MINMIINPTSLVNDSECEKPKNPASISSDGLPKSVEFEDLLIFFGTQICVFSRRSTWVALEFSRGQSGSGFEAIALTDEQH